MIIGVRIGPGRAVRGAPFPWVTSRLTCNVRGWPTSAVRLTHGSLADDERAGRGLRDHCRAPASPELRPSGPRTIPGRGPLTPCRPGKDIRRYVAWNGMLTCDDERCARKPPRWNEIAVNTGCAL
jgi:hypothetical protein